jgi:hypothetical protein
MVSCPNDSGDIWGAWGAATRGELGAASDRSKKNDTLLPLLGEPGGKQFHGLNVMRLQVPNN